MRAEVELLRARAEGAEVPYARGLSSLTRPARALATPLAVALLAALWLFAGSAAAAVSPLPESNYSVRPVCGAPSSGRAACLALQLKPQTAAAREKTHPIGFTRSAPIVAAKAKEGADGLRPADLKDAYFPAEAELPDAPQGSPQTIALVDAYNDYEAAEDLSVYSKEFGLPELPSCTSSSQTACFEQVGQDGQAGSHLPFPRTASELSSRETLCLGKSGTKREREAACEVVDEAEGWSVEISTDIEMAHAICQNCKVLLVEAESSAYSALEEAEDTAVSLGATEVSNSWGGGEPGAGEAQERRELEDATAFHHPGTVITASAGDDGYLNWVEQEAADRGEAGGYTDTAEFPASSPDVVAVGGTRLTMSGGKRVSESVWNQNAKPKSEGAGGGGCSTIFSAPSWQTSVPDWSQVGCGTKRAVADVAADADPYTGVAVYDSMPYLREEHGSTVETPRDWLPVGGTSVASPIVASMFALAGGAHGVEYPAKTLYSHLQTDSLYDVTSGGNGACDDDYLSCSGSLSPTSADYPLDCGEGALICNAAEGCGTNVYDGPTGVGSPNGIDGFEPGEEPAVVRECAAKSATGVGQTGAGSGSSGTGGPGSGGSGSEVSGGTGEETVGDGSSGSGSSGESTGGTSTSTGTAKSPATAKSTGTGSSKGSGSAEPAKPRLLGLALTRTAVLALRRHRRAGERLTFTFRLSAAAKLKVRLTRRTRSRWLKVLASRQLAEPAGKRSMGLPARGRIVLAPGRYRLTLTLASGGSRAVFFDVA